MEVYANVIYKGNEIVGFQGALRDITDRMRAEEELRESIIFLESMIDQSPVPTWISDDSGTLIRVNDACCELLNITQEEVVGKYNVLKDKLLNDSRILGY